MSVGSSAFSFGLDRRVEVNKDSLQLFVALQDRPEYELRISLRNINYIQEFRSPEGTDRVLHALVKEVQKAIYAHFEKGTFESSTDWGLFYDPRKKISQVIKAKNAAEAFDKVEGDYEKIPCENRVDGSQILLLDGGKGVKKLDPDLASLQEQPHVTHVAEAIYERVAPFRFVGESSPWPIIDRREKKEAVSKTRPFHIKEPLYRSFDESAKTIQSEFSHTFLKEAIWSDLIHEDVRYLAEDSWQRQEKARNTASTALKLLLGKKGGSGQEELDKYHLKRWLKKIAAREITVKKRGKNGADIQDYLLLDLAGRYRYGENHGEENGQERHRDFMQSIVSPT